jgi:hypothetical protein
MGPKDREYFMLRARQERQAAAHSHGPVRGRHEELASLYEMRVLYIDRGFIPVDDPDHPGAPVPKIFIAAW